MSPLLSTNFRGAISVVSKYGLVLG
jgi:hypothetical protein